MLTRFNIKQIASSAAPPPVTITHFDTLRAQVDVEKLKILLSPKTIFLQQQKCLNRFYNEPPSFSYSDLCLIRVSFTFLYHSRIIQELRDRGTCGNFLNNLRVSRANVTKCWNGLEINSSIKAV